MWDELESFLKKSKNIDLQIEKLQDKKLDYKQKINQTEGEINQMMIDEATLGKTPNEEKIEKLENRIDRHERKIVRLDQRINAIKSHKNEALEEYVPDLFESYKKKMEETRFELEELEKEIIPKAAAYLEHLSKIGKRKKKMENIHNTFTNTMKDFEHAYNKREYGYPSIGKFDSKQPYDINSQGVRLFVSERPNTTEVRKGITVEDQLLAVNSGAYPPHIVLYHLSGEQETNTDKAMAKIRKIERLSNEAPKVYQQFVNAEISLEGAYNELKSVKEEIRLTKEISELEESRRKPEYVFDRKKSAELDQRIRNLRKKKEKKKN